MLYLSLILILIGGILILFRDYGSIYNIYMKISGILLISIGAAALYILKYYILLYIIGGIIIAPTIIYYYNDNKKKYKNEL